MRHHPKGIQGRYCRFPTAARWMRCERTGFALPVAQVWAAQRRAARASRNSSPQKVSSRHIWVPTLPPPNNQQLSA